MQTNLNKRISSLITATIVSIGAIAYQKNSLLAQIVPDGTLEQENSIIQQDIIKGLPSDLITGGAIRQSNLFHSFQEFNINTGRAAYFTNPIGIENILTRITGNNPSNILGKLGVLGNANLFLLNPNGIIFGQNASLDLGGSFLATTANNVIFADGIQFTAKTTQNHSLLTINLPVGLGFGSNPGEILVQGLGNNLSRNSTTFAINRQTRPAGLEVSPGKTLALIGGKVNLTGGNITASGGRIELGSMQGGENITFTPINSGWIFQYPTQNFQDISLTQAASLDSSGNGGGNIQVQGRQISLTDGSTIFSVNLGTATAGNININALEKLNISGIKSQNGTFFSSLYTQSALGNADNINVQTGQLFLNEGARIQADTINSGMAGNITVNAQKIELTAGLSAPTLLTSQVQPQASGNAGNITLQTGELLLKNNLNQVSQITSITFGAGNAASVNVKATNVELIGSASSARTALAASAVQGSGNGGNLTVITDSLILRDGAIISVSNFGTRPSVPTGSGSPGNIQISTQSILLDNDSRITAATNNGDKGSIFLQSKNIQLRRGSQINTNAFNNSNGGNITMNTDTFVALEKSSITANAFQGKGGNININTSAIFLSSDSLITASSEKGINGVIEVKTLGFDVKNTFTTLTSSFVNENQIIAGSCLRNNQKKQALFSVTGRSGLLPTPYDPINNRYFSNQVQSLREKKNDSVTFSPIFKAWKMQNQEIKTWKLGDPILEAQGLIMTSTGSKILATLPNPAPVLANNLICDSPPES